MKKNLTLSIFSFLLLSATFIFYLNRMFVENIELKFYDFASSFRAVSQSKDIILIAIDDESILKIGRWPWGREKITSLLNYLNEDISRPSIIGLNILFSEPEDNKTKKTAEEIKTYYQELLNLKEIRENKKDSAFLIKINAIIDDSDNDTKLAAAISSHTNVALPMFFVIGELNSKIKNEPEYFKAMSASISHNSQNPQKETEASSFVLPLEMFAQKTKAIGHVNINADSDGTIRKHEALLFYNSAPYPSFPLAIALSSLGIKPNEVILKDSQALLIGNKEIKIDQENLFNMSYGKQGQIFKSASFYDVINGKVAGEIFKDKIVLVGLTAAGLGTTYVTPSGKNFSNLEYMATAVKNLLSSDYISIPEWAIMAEMSAILFIGLFSIFVLPRLKAANAAIFSAVLFLSLTGFSFYCLVYKNQWLRLNYASFLLLVSYLTIITRKFFFTERKKELIEVSAIETNKLLGLSFQGQGMLDLAFEKFRLCPLDDAMKDLLYNLALDFERKRQFNKAQVVYGHISEKDQNFKDIKQKIETMKKAADGVVLGGPAKSKEGTILVEGSSATPTLGRYEVLKELGKGAMGIVYLGKDPKINRTVAIKTMRFEEGLEEKEMKALKERFFREAQAAGNLSHPNIVKIFDAGEDQDIAYMAMELLKGEDLKKYTSKESLLSKEKVLIYMRQAAEALDYAHKNGVIHRDIKPANIMLLEDASLRVTDFGIARIQESSKTATGTVMGTPFYMSPEQISGKKVDGRADLFSLGVTMYELLSGEKPWKGGESIATLFYQITNEPYEKVSSLISDWGNVKISAESVNKIIEKALKKNPEERYQTGMEMANDIKAALEGLQINASSQETKKENPIPAAQPQQIKPASLNPEFKEMPKKQVPQTDLKPAAKETIQTPPSQTGQTTAKPQQNPKPAITTEKKDVFNNIKDSVQIPITEALGQPKKKEEILDIEKTLPLIYPQDEGDKK